MQNSLALQCNKVPVRFELKIIETRLLKVKSYYHQDFPQNLLCKYSDSA